jgi:integral membrane protein (TIGR01906 family)
MHKTKPAQAAHRHINKKRQPKSWCAGALGVALGISLFLILLHFVVFNTQSQIRQIETQDTIHTLGKTNAIHMHKQVISFLDGASTKLPVQMTQAEQNHLVDVRGAVRLGRLVLTILGMISIIGIVLRLAFVKKGKRKRECAILLLLCGITLLALTVLLLIGLGAFDTFFTLFHAVLFPQGNWIFPQNSLLITLYPESFFIELLTKLIVAAAGSALMLISAGLLLRHNSPVKR